MGINLRGDRQRMPATAGRSVPKARNWRCPADSYSSVTEKEALALHAKRARNRVSFQGIAIIGGFWRETRMLLTARWLIFALALMTGFANAQLSSDWHTCTGDPRGDWDRQISSCTALIRSGKESDENVAIAYYNRALAYENKEDYERAIADYSEVIQSRSERCQRIILSKPQQGKDRR